MRADRLLTLLMLLQSRGKLSAARLARELEVSQRTIYRDVEALSTAGVPVYAEKGPGGGIALLESYRTTLTGLTAEESRALFMLNIPAPLAQLGVSQELRTALLKLSAALPASQRADEERTRQRFHLDAVGWSQSLEPAPYLQLVQQALWNDRRLKLFYRTFFGTLIERVGEPLGLVAKASVWYLVYTEAEVRRVVRVADLLQVEVLPETFSRPPEFNLVAFWQAWCAEVAAQPRFIARVRVAPQLVSDLPRYFGEAVRAQMEQAVPDDRGWIELALPFEHFFAARERILGFGRALEVLEPLPLRESVADFAAQIMALYQDKQES